MSKVQERHYVSKEPGKVITLPEGLTFLDPHGRTRTMIPFPARGGKMAKSSDPKIHDFLEGVKDPKGDFEFKGNTYSTLPCRAFMRNVIERIPTPQEIKQREVEKAQAATLVAYKALVNKPGVSLDVSKMPDSDIRDLAQNIGVSTSKDGKNLPSV